MSNELRHRSTSQRSTAPEAAPITMTSYDESHLSARGLLSASPTHSSAVMKIHVPAIYTVLPAAVQRFLSRCCPRSMSPQWKRRYLIAAGQYLYRFKSEDGSTPKGSPISVVTIDTRVITKNNVADDEINTVFGLMPEGCEAAFEVSSVGKTQYFAVESQEEAMIWVNSLRQMRQDAITRNMGHSKNIPYPPELKSFDASASRLVQQKNRIKRRLEAMNTKEQEMQSFGGGSLGVTTGMGYYS